ncbi:TPA: hypothetical protein R2P05_000818 [Campylobacter jejuni]|nr:hypothetical protein [Campylobacter jejuni]EFN6207317.1 hypothetical protein [Campylobacter jejuni]HEC2934446.1 hypothetical protein [Campylobacter jejuni]HEC2939791.1 hypothetical protein [Campylobacter jejuni]HEC2941641.1 hypothetical protein [Campylobacter jejuni]
MKLQDFDFRIWDYKRKTFINYQCQMSFVFNNERNKENYLKVMDCFDNKNPKNNEFYGLKSYNSNDIEIELFTGLYDKNGKKIYENDILKFRFNFYNGTQEIIAYANTITYNGLFFTSKDNGLFPRIDDYSYRYLESEFNFSMEIIGNIHENPELLKC